MSIDGISAASCRSGQASEQPFATTGVSCRSSPLCRSVLRPARTDSARPAFSIMIWKRWSGFPTRSCSMARQLPSGHRVDPKRLTSSSWDSNLRPLTGGGMRSNCKGMERPDLKSMAVARPDGAPDQVAADFFPNFSTVRSALEAGRIGVWSWDLATNVVTWSSNMEAIHGLPPAVSTARIGSSNMMCMQTIGRA